MLHSRVNTYHCQSSISTRQVRTTKRRMGKDSSIRLNITNHSLPTTKTYLLKEYVDDFQGVGTLPGGPYHIRLNQYNQPIQHPPCSIQVGMQKAYRAELDRLLVEGIIAKVHEHTEWVNSMVPVLKPDGTTRLYLDSKDLNKAIERNQ